MTGRSADYRAELASLEFHWGSAYQIDCNPGAVPERWVAWRRDGQGGQLSAANADEMFQVIIDDYHRMPVSREVCP